MTKHKRREGYKGGCGCNCRILEADMLDVSHMRDIIIYLPLFVLGAAHLICIQVIHVPDGSGTAGGGIPGLKMGRATVGETSSTFGSEQLRSCLRLGW